jgi:hypothetical protein
MSLFLVLAATASLHATPTPQAEPSRPTMRHGSPGLIDVSRFDDKGMVRPVAAAPCVSDNFTKWPEGGCLRATQHAPQRK